MMMMVESSLLLEEEAVEKTGTPRITSTQRCERRRPACRTAGLRVE
jgi:hypothetical protein